MYEACQASKRRLSNPLGPSDPVTPRHPHSRGGGVVGSSSNWRGWVIVLPTHPDKYMLARLNPLCPEPPLRRVCAMRVGASMACVCVCVWDGPAHTQSYTVYLKTFTGQSVSFCRVAAWCTCALGLWRHSLPRPLDYRCCCLRALTARRARTIAPTYTGSTLR